MASRDVARSDGAARTARPTHARAAMTDTRENKATQFGSQNRVVERTGVRFDAHAQPLAGPAMPLYSCLHERT